MKVTFVEYTIEDKTDLLNMMAAFNAIDGYPFDHLVAEKTLFEFTTTPSLGRLYMIKNSKENIGYILLTFGFSFEYQGRDAFIDELYIIDDYQNRGIGTMTMHFITAAAMQLKVNAIHLEVEKHNKRAHQLYIKQGFEPHDRTLLTKNIKTMEP